jgi:hypothetical protein
MIQRGTRAILLSAFRDSNFPIGTVASALRYVAKDVMMGIDRVSASKSAGHLKARLVKGGIGEPLITEFLSSVPSVNEFTVKQHIAILKASGDYALIIEAE